ncbi:MAG: DUF3750 domain-containing protein [Geminicoccaceae bacterium]|nr:DUF3750 domain-containing protein [Geminicoccaceae bacterium]
MRTFLVVVLLLLVPIAVQAYGQWNEVRHWSETRWDSARVAPDPAATKEAAVQVYGARTWGRKGILAVHTWVIVKPENAQAWTRYDVAGWGVQSGRKAIRRDMRVADGYWAGNPPILLAELRGDKAAKAIDRIEALVRAYPYDHTYRLWPGPNSNTFTAMVGRAVPALRLDLPPTAIGKDWLPWTRPFALAPSGTGVQVSIEGAFGVIVALQEGVEVNFLGLTLGLDFLKPALKLPAMGRVGFG